MNLQHLSNELLLVKHKNGIKAIQPERYSARSNGAAIASVANILKLPSSVYIMERSESRFVHMNECNATVVGGTSIQDTYGKNVTSFSDPLNAAKVIENDKRVIATEKLLVVEEEADIIATKEHVHALTFKMPFYMDDNSLYGVFGVSVFIGKHSLGQALSEVVGLGLLSPNEVTMAAYASPIPVNNHFLSRREKQVLGYVAKGLTSRLIAEKLSLSSRTVEHHIENIKQKLGAKSKYDLIEIYQHYDG